MFFTLSCFPKILITSSPFSRKVATRYGGLFRPSSSGRMFGNFFRSDFLIFLGLFRFFD
jgi:hypothetical protein